MRLIENSSVADSNQQNLYKNLAEGLQANLTRIQRYCVQYPEWKSGKKLIPTKESNSIESFLSFNRRIEYTNAQVFNSNSASLLGVASAKAKQYSPSDPAVLRIEGTSEPTLLISFDSDEMNNRPLVLYMPNQLALNPKNILMQYVAYAEAVDEAYSKMRGESWDKRGDHVGYYSRTSLFTDEYKASFDECRIGQALEFHHMAKLILHIRELEKIQKQPLNMQTALICYQDNNNQYPFLSGDQAKGNRYLLSEKNLTWIKQQITLRVMNGHLRGNIYRESTVCLESEDECLARLKSEVSLILTTNIRELFSATELLALISAAANLFNERVEKQQFAQDDKGNNVQLLTDNRTSFASKYLFAQKAPQFARFLASLEPLFTFSLISEKLKKDKATATYLFTCLFGDQAQLKIYEDKYRQSERS